MLVKKKKAATKGRRPAKIGRARKASKESTALTTTRGATRKATMDAVDDESEAMVPAGDGDVTTTMGPRYSADVNFSASDVNLPRLRLGQQMTPEVSEGDAKAGQWLLTGEDPHDKVIFVPLAHGAGRVCQEDDVIVCRSDDAQIGVGDYGKGSKKNPTGQCARCPMSQWTKDRKQKSVPPPCTFYYSYLGWSHTHQTLAQFDAKKTAINAGKMINSFAMKFKAFGGFAVELTSLAIKGGLGTYYQPVVKLAKVDKKVLAEAAENAPF